MSRPPADPEANNRSDAIYFAATEAAFRALCEDLLPEIKKPETSAELALLLERGPGDLTWKVLEEALIDISGKKKASQRTTSIRSEGRFIAGEDGVLAGTLPAARCFELLDDNAEVVWQKTDGSHFKKGEVLGEVRGAPAALLAAERSALNFLSHLSGIATATRALRDAARKVSDRVEIRDTRKTVPGLRLLEKEAVRAGGGANHRVGLYDGILLKDNHLEIVRALGLPIAKTLAVFVRSALENDHQTEIEIEADDVETAVAAAEAGARVVLCDNMPPEDVARVVSVIGDRAKVEASGGIDLENIGAYAAAGVDYIAVGYITHSAPAIDISFEIVDAEWV